MNITFAMWRQIGDRHQVSCWSCGASKDLWCIQPSKHHRCDMHDRPRTWRGLRDCIHMGLQGRRLPYDHGAAGAVSVGGGLGWGNGSSQKFTAWIKILTSDLLLTTGCLKRSNDHPTVYIYIYICYIRFLYVYIIHNSSSCIWLGESRLILVWFQTYGFLGPP